MQGSRYAFVETKALRHRSVAMHASKELFIRFILDVGTLIGSCILNMMTWELEMNHRSLIFLCSITSGRFVSATAILLGISDFIPSNPFSDELFLPGFPPWGACIPV